jgi:hypothetical protein
LAVAVLLLLRWRRVLRCAAVLVVLVLVVVLGASVRRVVAVLAGRTLLLRWVDGASVASLLSVGGSAGMTALLLGRRAAVLGVAAVLRLLVLARCGRTVALARRLVALMLPAIAGLLVLAVASLLVLIMGAILAWRRRSVRVVARGGGVRSAGLVRRGWSAAGVRVAL